MLYGRLTPVALHEQSCVARDYALRAAMRPEVTLACLLGIPVLHQDAGLRFFRRMAPEDQIAAIGAAVDGEDA